MSGNEYDLKLMLVVKAVRKLRGLKQVNVANDLDIDRSQYCRIENGAVIISTGKLKQIAAILNTSHYSLLSIADIVFGEENEVLSEQELYEQLLTSPLITENIGFSKEELIAIFSEARK